MSQEYNTERDLHQHGMINPLVITTPQYLFFTHDCDILLLCQRLSDHKLACVQAAELLKIMFGVGDIGVQAAVLIYPQLTDPDQAEAVSLSEGVHGCGAGAGSARVWSACVFVRGVHVHLILYYMTSSGARCCFSVARRKGASEDGYCGTVT